MVKRRFLPLFRMLTDWHVADPGRHPPPPARFNWHALRHFAVSCWISDRYTAQQGHAAAHQTCLAHLARDVAYAVEVSADPVPLRLQLWLQSVFALAERVTDLAASTLAANGGRWSGGLPTSCPHRAAAI